MKILLTSDWNLSSTNGVATSLFDLLNGLRTQGHDARLLTLKNQSSEDSSPDYIYMAPSLNASFVYPEARCAVPGSQHFMRSILKWKPDIVHSHSEFSTFNNARHVSRHLLIPHVHTYHTIYENYTHYFSPNPKLGRWGIARYCRNRLNRADAIIVPSEKTADHIAHYQLRKPIFTVPSGIDLSYFDTKPSESDLAKKKRELGIPDNAVILLHLGRIAREKNIERILKTMADLTIPTPHLIIVGDGPYTDTIRQLVHLYQLDGFVHFTGMVPHNQVAFYYHLADLFVNASTSETQGLTFGEALASSLPVLCYEDSCIKDVILNDYNGYQCKSSEEFAQRLNDLIEHPEKRADFAKNARQYIADHFSQEQFTYNILNVYENTQHSFIPNHKSLF